MRCDWCGYSICKVVYGGFLGEYEDFTCLCPYCVNERRLYKSLRRYVWAEITGNYVRTD